ncbi:uncharacterized protein LOC107225975 [Neodiprion lecontei]|uniref:Uncharacterized protein LOC107225975 n=1 Tax=Neodiprion lecontei TaxID=441921 RepID=A0A6J0C6A8_NEOLC|nr:uncharacterized protein LOC107225975 [Neodiprion lecontei]
MSHPVTIQPNTMFTISGPTINPTTNYLKTLPGILRLLEVMLGIVCVGIIGYAQTTIGNVIDEVYPKLHIPASGLMNNFNGLKLDDNINSVNFGTIPSSVNQYGLIVKDFKPSAYAANIPVLGIVTSFIVTRPYSMFFFLMTTTFMVASFILLISCIASFSINLIISKGDYLQDVLYHVIGFVLLLAASISVLIETTLNGSNLVVELVFPSKNAVTAASVIGMVNALLYLLSAKLALKSYRAEGCGRTGFTA